MEINPSGSVLISGIGFSGYRSFASWQELHFDTNVTVLAGVNNSGKSNVLRFLQEILPQTQKEIVRGSKIVPVLPDRTLIDTPNGFDFTSPFEIGIPIKKKSRNKPRFNFRHTKSLEEYQEALMYLLQEEDGTFWAHYVEKNGQLEPSLEKINYAISEWPSWENDSPRVLSAMGGGIMDQNDIMSRLFKSIGGFANLPEVATIQSFRRIDGSPDIEPDWLSGRGIIQALGAMQSPEWGSWNSSQGKWNRINKFVQTVLGDQNAELRIPHNFSTIQVQTPQRVLPLSSLGSGIEQVIVLAAAATATTKSLVCIEEPETNLHPLLQKKLIRYLAESTDNQYVIATHSTHLLDYKSATAYHIQLTTKGSVAKVARRPNELVSICHDLGYRSSDLIQANSVIWLEGPSDRIYVKRWIQIVDPELTEGIDYSLMFYGGRLLSNLTVDDDAIEDFINLRQLNRMSAIVIDSDKTSRSSSINATKKRICEEFSNSDPRFGFAWVTKCNTIENYVPEEVLKNSVSKVHPNVALDSFNQWQNPLKGKMTGTRLNKVKIAESACKNINLENFNVYKLKKDVSDLCKFIRSAGQQSTAPRSIDFEQEI